MDIDKEVTKLISQLALKVLTPIMVFTIIIFGGTGYFIAISRSISPTFDFDSALWTWLIVCWLFTPLCGAILWIQSVKAINSPQKSRKPRKRSNNNNRDVVNGS
ncbi:hypothetical protein LWE69_19950 [Paenibacillus sp. UKAQ_18]|nr:hypothetical protein [Paenibacillus sp. UKAQ_18]